MGSARTSYWFYMFLSLPIHYKHRGELMVVLIGDLKCVVVRKSV